MPLPWKKAKIGRISRFVADLRSSKRGGSLVVETGFPTSLIDLIVKNRDRLKKPSKKKPLETSGSTCLSSPSVNSSNSKFSLSPLVVPTPEISSPIQLSPTPVPSALQIEGPSTPISKEIAPPLVANKVEDVAKVPVSNGRAFMAVVELFFMLILALETRRLAIGVTLSAFTLLFLEFAAERVFGFLKPCADARRSFKCFVERVLFFVRPEKGLAGVDETAVADKAIRLKQEDLGSRHRGEEEKEEEQAADNEAFRLGVSNPTWIEEIQYIDPEYDLLSREKKWGFEESNQRRILGKDEGAVQGRDLKSRRTSSDKLKEKILKKFIPKKFRGSKRPIGKQQQVLSNFGVSNFDEDEKLQRIDEYVRKEENEQGEQEYQLEPEKEEIEIYDIHGFSCVSQVDLDVIVVEKNNGRKLRKSLGYLILFVIVLCGLIGGRFMAGVVTIVWCLLVKSVEALKRRE